MLDQTKYNLYQYMFEKEARYENDLTQLLNNVSYRKADCLDHLEMIMAIVRLDTSRQIFHDISSILRKWRV